MLDIRKRVHIYAAATRFVVVPVRHIDGECVEVVPVQRVGLMMGRDTVGELAKAIDKSAVYPPVELGVRPALWDGDNGRWWNHNLLYVQLLWCGDRVQFATQRREGADARVNCPWCDDQVDSLFGNKPTQ